MAATGEGKKEEADYKRLHSFPLIRVGVGAMEGKYQAGTHHDNNILSAFKSSLFFCNDRNLKCVCK